MPTFPDRISDLFRPSATWETLCLRASLMRRLRSFFQEQDFVEVETPLVSHEIIAESYNDPFPAVFGWLQTSPEAHMKRLLAAFRSSGISAIYQVTRSFRADERGRLHNPEFTIVEWYRIGDAMEAGMEFLDQFCRVVLDAPPATRTAFADAFLRDVGICPHTATVRELATAARDRGLDLPIGIHPRDRNEWLDFLHLRLVEQNLGRWGPEIVYHYPASQAGLASIRHQAGRPPVAERFELYWHGIELANGYHELTDPRELRQRLNQASTNRMAAGKDPLQEPAWLLSAMEAGLPACSGVALGFDRLAMIASGAESIDEVLTFPAERA
ncbi:MAG: EF-P lysine aminoacylase GenX [Pirellulales bacterium]|nr:EF-P lysine aminoacylase GenX [Pirellulales bacterium]